MKNSDQPAFANSGIEGSDRFTFSSGFTKLEYATIEAMKGLLSNSEIARRFPNQDDFFNAVRIQSKNIAEQALAQLSSTEETK